MVSSPFKEGMTPKKRREKLFERLLKNYTQWKAFVEDEGLHTIIVEGEEFSFWDLLEGLDTLPLRQRQAIWLLCIEDKREEDAALQMGFTKWSTPAQLYKNLGLAKLVEYYDNEVYRERARRKTLEKKKRGKT